MIFEYKILFSETLANEKNLDAHGQASWELVAIVYATDAPSTGWYYYFKRERKKRD